ncbi:hypothetical protein JXA80_05300 [bacterium]|nr:hypothetical protein [candidate division CSSED10-310 bacterium]
MMKQKAMKRQNTFSSSIFLWFLVVSSMGLMMGPGVAGKDILPPYLVNPIPEPGSIAENWFFIRTGVLDDESGVDSNDDRIQVQINGSPPRVKPIIEPSYGNRGIQITLILGEQEKQDLITVTVEAYDLAAEPNLMREEWSFFVSSVAQDRPIIGTYPEDHRSLAHSVEGGELRFTWVSMDPYDHFRMEFILGNGQSGTMDISTPELESSFQTVSFSASGISLDDWEQMAMLGELAWRVAPVDRIGGSLLKAYSAVRRVMYVPENVPILARPYHNALLDPVYPPVFEWKSLDFALDGYLVVFARLDESGGYSGDIHIFETPVFVRTIPLDDNSWKGFADGDWAWTVFGKLPDGSFSQFMIQRFTKL